MSFIYIKNNKGPRIDPWGTPQVMFIRVDLHPFNRHIVGDSLNKNETNRVQHRGYRNAVIYLRVYYN